MRIEKALEYFKWKYENVHKPTEKELEAFKAIIEYKEKVEDINLQQNNNFAKLWIHQLMLLSNTEMYTAERSIQVIDEILSKSVYEWCLELQDKLAIMRFNSLSKQGATDEELKEALAFEMDLDNVIKFVSKNINRNIMLYEK